MDIFCRLTGFARTAPWWILAVSVLVAVLIYYPGLNGPFLVDDESSIKHNSYLKIEGVRAKDLQMVAFVQEPAVDLGGPLARASLALNHYYWGGEAFSFKVVNFLLHVFNGGLFYMLAALLLRHLQGVGYLHARLYASLAAFAWLLHPLNLAVVLHVSERSTVLAVFFGLLALLSYVQGRLSVAKGGFLSGVVFLVLALVCYTAAVASRQEAFLLLIVMLMLEWFVFWSRDVRSNRENAVMRNLFVWGLMLLIAVVFLYWHNGVKADLFPATISLSERLLTQPRILLYSLGMIVFPRPSVFGLFHDDFSLSTGLFSPPSTLFALVIVVAMVSLLLRYKRKQPVAALFILLFIAVYIYQGFVCCATHAGERLNYPFSFGVLLAVVLGIMAVSRSLLSMNGKVAIVLIFGLFFASVTYARAKAWQDMNRWTFTMLKNHPASAAANYQAAVMYVELSQNLQGGSAQAEEYLRQAVEHFEKSASLKQGDAAPLLAVMLLDAMSRISSEKSTLDALLGGTPPLQRSPLVLNRINILQRAKLALQTGTLSKWAVDNLIRLSNCERGGQCRLDVGYIDDLLGSALANETLPATSAYRARILDELAQRQFVAGNLAEAKRLALQVMSIAPENASYALNAAVIMAANGDVDLAMGYVGEVLAGAHPEAVKARAYVLRNSLKAGSK